MSDHNCIRIDLAENGVSTRQRKLTTPIAWKTPRETQSRVINDITGYFLDKEAYVSPHAIVNALM